MPQVPITEQKPGNHKIMKKFEFEKPMAIHMLYES